MRRGLMLFALCLSTLLAQKATTPPSYKDLKFPPLGKIEIPNVERFTLPNGMRVYLLEDHGLPLVGGFALVRPAICSIHPTRSAWPPQPAWSCEPAVR